MKNLTKLALTGALIFGLNSCGDNKKYQDFAKFMIKEGKLTDNGESIIYFSKENKEYQLFYETGSFFDEENLGIFIYGRNSLEKFSDENLNGLDYYGFEFESRNLLVNRVFQSKENKNKYEMLIDSIPKWYAESKK